MKAIHCVYQIFNTKNSRSYIGSTVNFSQRKRRHFNDLHKREGTVRAALLLQQWLKGSG